MSSGTTVSGDVLSELQFTRINDNTNSLKILMCISMFFNVKVTNIKK